MTQTIQKEFPPHASENIKKLSLTMSGFWGPRFWNCNLSGHTGFQLAVHRIRACADAASQIITDGNDRAFSPNLFPSGMRCRRDSFSSDQTSGKPALLTIR